MATSTIQLTEQEASELKRRQAENPALGLIHLDDRTHICSYQAHPFPSRAHADATWALMDLLRDMNRQRAYAHPMYQTLVQRVAVAEAGYGKHYSGFRRATRHEITLIGEPFEGDSREKARTSARRVAERMVGDVYPRPWPGKADMVADLCAIARDDVFERRISRPERQAQIVPERALEETREHAIAGYGL